MIDSNISTKPNTGQPSFYTPTQDERTMAILAHVLTIFFGFIPPLIIWLIKKEESKYVAEQAKESLNFQLTLLLMYIALAITLIGFILFFVPYILGIVFAIVATINASDNKIYKYPFCIRFFK
jgi:uncharacterized protein